MMTVMLVKGRTGGQSPKDGGDEDLKKPYKEQSSKIIRRANETLPDFKERWTEKMGYIQGVPKVMQISACVTNFECPELAPHFADQVPQTMTEMMQRVDDFVKSEEPYKSTELPKGQQPEMGHGTPFRDGWLPRSDQGNKHQKMDNYGRRDHYQPHVPPRAQDRSEILATELQLQLPPCPPTVALSKKENVDRVINMVQEIGDCWKRKSWRSKPEEWIIVPITFPPVVAKDVSDDPLVIEAEAEGYWVRRVFVDQGAAVQVMFEHYFDNYSSAIKARLTLT
nr:reverse transcriptase domain-containing protein [Tanacetum cinerariifolium]